MGRRGWRSRKQEEAAPSVAQSGNALARNVATLRRVVKEIRDPSPVDDDTGRSVWDDITAMCAPEGLAAVRRQRAGETPELPEQLLPVEDLLEALKPEVEAKVLLSALEVVDDLGALAEPHGADVLAALGAAGALACALHSRYGSEVQQRAAATLGRLVAKSEVMRGSLPSSGVLEALVQALAPGSWELLSELHGMCRDPGAPLGAADQCWYVPGTVKALQQVVAAQSAMPLLVKLLAAHENTAWQVADLVTAMVSGHAGNHQGLETASLAAVVELLDSSGGEGGLIRRAAHKVLQRACRWEQDGEVCSRPESQEAVAAAGGVEKLAGLLGSLPAAGYSLRAVAWDHPGNQQRLADHETAITALVKQLGGDCKESVASAAAALSALSLPKCQELAVGCGATPALMALLEAPAGEPAVQASALDALGALCRGHEDHQALVAAHGGIALLAGLLDCEKDAVVKASAVVALGSVAGGNPGTQKLLVTALPDVAPKLLHLLEPGSPPAVQMAAATTIKAVCKGNKYMQDAAVASGSVPGLQGLIRSTTAPVYVKAAAVLALGAVLGDSKLLAATSGSLACLAGLVGEEQPGAVRKAAAKVLRGFDSTVVGKVLNGLAKVQRSGRAKLQPAS